MSTNASITTVVITGRRIHSTQFGKAHDGAFRSLGADEVVALSTFTDAPGYSRS